MAAGKTDACVTAGSDIEEEIVVYDIRDLTACRAVEAKKDHSSHEPTFRLFDAVLVMASLITYLTDTGTDIAVTIVYLQSGHYTWAGLTAGLVLLPSFITQCFSARWYHADGKLTGARMWLVHILHLQPLERYVKVFQAGMEARASGSAKDLQGYYYQQNDVSMLRLFETFLESAPQLTLQLYIMVATNDATWITGVSAGISLVAVGWAVSIYNHALRQAHRDEYYLQWPGLVLHTVWHIGVVAARVAALVAFASLYKAWVFLFVGVHWVLMTIWVVLQSTDFCPTQPEERLFNGVVGVIYIYCFFSLKEGATRWRLLFFYTVLFAENLVLVAVWYPFRAEDGWTTGAIIAVVFGAFFLGIGCMVIYYRFCHPSGPIYCCPQEPEDTSPTLPRKASGLYHLQVDLIPRASTILLPRLEQLKPQTSLAMMAPPVVYKEVLSPVTASQVGNVPGCRRFINYNVTLELSDTSIFRHYSIEASQCMAEMSQCATLYGEGIDLTVADIANTRQSQPPETQPQAALSIQRSPQYSFAFMDEDVSTMSSNYGSEAGSGSGAVSGSGMDSGMSSVGSSEPQLGKNSSGVAHARDSGCVHTSTETGHGSLCDCDRISSAISSAHSRDLPLEAATTERTTGAPPVTPRLTHHGMLTVLPGFSPIADEKKPSTFAGCSRFPTTNWQHTETLVSTPHRKMLSHGPMFLVGNANQPTEECYNQATYLRRNLELQAPLASPEVSLTESMCDLGDTQKNDIFDDISNDAELNQSIYDNVEPSATETTDASLGVYLDNVSGLTYISQYNSPELAQSEL